MRKMFEVKAHDEDEFGPFTLDYGNVDEDALMLILAKNENVEYKEVG